MPASGAAARFRSACVQCRASDGAIVLGLPGGAEAAVLTGTARRVWELLDYPVSLDALAETLSAEFDAPPDAIRADVETLVADLAARGLVSVHEGGLDPIRERYLALLKKAVSNLLYPELELQIRHLEGGGSGLSGKDLHRFQRDIAQNLPEEHQRLLDAKQQGTGHIRYAHTMIGVARLTNIERCAEQVFADGIAGDFLEAGVCQGGAAIFMRGLQVAHGEKQRKTWVVDSFEGVPASVDRRDRGYGLDLEEPRQPWLAFGEAAVRDRFARYGLLDAGVRFVAGWLAESLPRADVGPLAILRVDVDLYSSTLDCLDLLYDKVVPGGFVIVDDYGFLKCCRDAVDAFRARRGVTEPIRWIDGSGICWRKAGAGA